MEKKFFFVDNTKLKNSSLYIRRLALWPSLSMDYQHFSIRRVPAWLPLIDTVESMDDKLLGLNPYIFGCICMCVCVPMCVCVAKQDL